MVKRLLFSVVLMAATLLAVAQTTVTVGTGTTKTRTAPFNNYFKNGSAAMIYAASNFDAACDISSIAFECVSAINKSAEIHIYVGVKSGDTFSSSSDWPDASKLTEVYSNSNATIGAQTGWEVYNFSNAYSYDPTQGNLVVVVCRKSSEYSGMYAYGYTSTSNAVLYKSNDTDATAGELNSVVSTTGYRSADLPNTQFSLTYTGAVCNRPASAPVVSNITSTSADLVWGAANGVGTYQYVVVLADSTPDWSVAHSATDTTAQLTGLAANTQYDVYVRSYCDASTQSSALSRTFRTECGVEALPWSEDFESGAVPCWVLPASGVTVGYNSSYAIGAKTMKFATASDVVVVLPNLGDVNGQQLTFNYRCEGTGTNADMGQFDAGYVTDAHDASTFVSFGTTYPRVYAYTEKNVLLKGVPANARLAFKYHDATSASWYAFLDNISVAEPPACARPDEVQVDDVSQTTAHLVWTSEASQHYALVKNGNDTLFNDVVSGAELTLDPLSPGTRYSNLSVWVAAICSASEVSDTLKTTVSFTTECAVLDIASARYTQSFEGTSKGNVPCWGFNSTSSSYPTITTSYGANGTSSSLSFGGYLTSYSGNYTAYAILPEVSDAVADLMLTFYLKGYSSTKAYNDSIQIGVLSDTTDMSTFERVACVQASSSSWALQEIDLSSYSGKGKFVALKRMPVAYSSYYYGSYVDEVTLRLLPTCHKPDSIRFVSAGLNDATFAWVGESDDYHVTVKKGTTTLYDANVNGRQAVVPNLTAATSYNVTVTVKAVCAPGEESDEVSASLSFVTECDVVAALPWSENFESATSNQMPLCWSKPGTASFPYAYNSTYWAHGGSMSLYFYGGTSYYGEQIVVLPAFGFDINTAQLRFWHKEGYTAANYPSAEVGVMSDPNDASTFVVLKTLDKSTSYVQEEINIVADASHTYIAIRVPATGSYVNSIYFDDFELVAKPSCAKPENVTATDVTTNSAVIRWESEAALGDSILVKNGNDTLYNVLTTADSLLVENLNPATQYTLTVTLKAICGASDKSDVVTKTFSFTTECVAITTFPWIENFESMTASAVAPCWDNSASETSTLASNPEIVWGVYSYLSNKSLYMKNYSVRSGSAVVNTPTIELPADKAYILTFDYSNRANCGDLKVNISTDGGANFTQLGAYGTTSGTDYSNPGTFVSKEISLFDYKGQSVIIQFAAVSNYGNGAIWLDNVAVNEAPSCVKPSNIHVIDSLATTSSAVVAWSAPAQGAAQYKVLVKNGADTLVNNVLTADTFYVVTNLNPSTAYSLSVGVASVCGEGDESDVLTASVSFATECAPIAALPWSEGFESATSTKMPICWTKLGTASYPYAYSYNARTGSNGLYFYGGSSNYGEEIAVLPAFGFDINTAQLRFWHKEGYTAANYPSAEVGVMSDPSDASTFVVLKTLDKSTTYTQEEINITADASHTYIAIRVPATASAMGYYFDDFELVAKPSCPKPENVTVGDITTTSAIIRWASDGLLGDSILVKNGTDTLYNVLATGDSLLVENLAPASVYTLAVSLKAVCGEGESSEVRTTSLTFATECVVITTFPWSDGFESYTSGTAVKNLPCYSGYAVQGSANDWTVMSSSSSAHTGSKFLQINYTSTSVRTIAAVELPEMLFEADAQYEFNYWLKGSASATTDTIVVFVGDSVLRTLHTKNDIGGNWKEYTDTIVGTGEAVSLGFSFSNANGWWAYLDDVTVSKIEGGITTSIDLNAVEVKAVKILRGGHVYILRGGAMYDVTGRKVE